jgi:hypothetical protein
MTVSFFFASLVFLTLWTGYWEYAGGHNVGDVLNIVGRYALTVAAWLKV